MSLESEVKDLIREELNEWVQEDGTLDDKVSEAVEDFDFSDPIRNVLNDSEELFVGAHRKLFVEDVEATKKLIRETLKEWVNESEDLKNIIKNEMDDYKFHDDIQYELRQWDFSEQIRNELEDAEDLFKKEVSAQLERLILGPENELHRWLVNNLECVPQDSRLYAAFRWAWLCVARKEQTPEKAQESYRAFESHMDRLLGSETWLSVMATLLQPKLNARKKPWWKKILFWL